MINTARFKRLSYLLFIACLGLGNAHAEQDGPPQPADVRSGIVDSIHPADGVIVVDDRQYALPSRLIGASSIQPGTEIRFRFVQQGEQKVITELLERRR